MKTSFSSSWIRSIQPRKQKKYRYNAPAHIRGKFLSVHLAPTLRKKYETRSLRVRVGDTVKVTRGQFRRKEGKVERVDLGRTKVYITGIDHTKKDGSKVQFPITPSNLMITNVVKDDSRRFKRIKNEQATS